MKNITTYELITPKKFIYSWLFLLFLFRSSLQWGLMQTGFSVSKQVVTFLFILFGEYVNFFMPISMRYAYIAIFPMNLFEPVILK